MAKPRFHRLVQSDLRAALAYYDATGGKKLGDRFFQAVEKTIEEVLRNPGGYHFAVEPLRRAPIKSFPFHFIFEWRGGTIRFLVLRHNRRRPDLGLRRR